jgi:hypothetical protein
MARVMVMGSEPLQGKVSIVYMIGNIIANPLEHYNYQGNVWCGPFPQSWFRSRARLRILGCIVALSLGSIASLLLGLRIAHDWRLRAYGVYFRGDISILQLFSVSAKKIGRRKEGSGLSLSLGDRSPTAWRRERGAQPLQQPSTCR